MEKLLPKGWEVVKSDLISDITDYVANGSFQSLSENVKTYDNEEYAILLRLKDFSNDFKNNLKYVDEKSYKFLAKSEIKEGDLFVSNVGNPGICYLVPNLDKPVTLGPNGIRLRVSKYGDISFIKYYLESPQGRKEINEITTGTAQLKFNKTDFRNLLFPLPPLPEQKRIVAKLDKLFAQHEKIKKALDRIPQLLKTFRQQVLTQAVTGKLNKVSVLQNKLVSDFFEVKTGATPKKGVSKYYEDATIPWIKSGEVKNTFIYNVDEYISEIAVKETNAKVFPKDTILVAMYGEGKTRGQVGWMKVEAATNQAVAALVNENLNEWTRRYIYLFCLSQYNEIRAKAEGGNQPNLNLSKIKNWEISIPQKVSEQQEIVRRVESLFDKADVIETRYQVLKAKIDSLPQSILHKAFKGELVPQLPTDGDAKDLLAEIMALKEEVKGRKKK